MMAPMDDIQITMKDGHFHIEGFPDAVKLARVEGEKAHKLKDLALHRNDLAFAKQCLKSINEDATSHLIQEVFWQCAIVNFVKCFSNGARRSLKGGSIYHSPEALEAWQHFLDLRNKHIAHDVNVFATVEVGAAINPPEQERRIAKILCPTLRVSTLDDGAFGNLTLLIDEALDWVNKEQDRLCDAITSDLEKESHETLMNRPNVVYTVPTPKDINRGRRATPKPDVF